ncbi:hypothetical protein [Elongatibacter sediminis]|uniref:Lipoprotein n=1 Tax=Elongatibacter sediminis TaxID=3119006 RepID=A0AAW9REM8_9GAMM
MQKPLLACAATLVLCACGDSAESQSSASTDPSAETRSANPSSKGGRKAPKWTFSIDGMPTLSGRMVTGVIMNGYGNYAFADGRSTASVRLVEGSTASTMNFNFREEEMRCSNFGDAQATVDGDKAFVSGEVKCFAKGVDPADGAAANIEGWFQLKK